MAAPDPSYFVTASNRINNSSLTTTQTFWRSPPPSHLDEFLRRTDCCYGIGKGEMVRTAEVAGRSVGRSVGTTRRRPTARAARQIMLYVCGSGAAGAAAATPGCSVAPRERRGPENEVRPCACELRTSEACARAECYPHSPLFFSLVDGTTVSAMRRGTFSAMPCRQPWASTYGLWLSGTLSLFYKGHDSVELPCQGEVTRVARICAFIPTVLLSFFCSLYHSLFLPPLLPDMGEKERRASLL